MKTLLLTATALVAFAAPAFATADEDTRTAASLYLITNITTLCPNGDYQPDQRLKMIAPLAWANVSEELKQRGQALVDARIKKDGSEKFCTGLSEKMNEPSKPPVVAPRMQTPDYGAADIQRAVKTYEANEVRFQRDFVGKSIDFVSVFNRASSRWIGNGYRITFGNGSFGGGVDCVITDQTLLDKIVEWNKGQRVRIFGIIKDVTVGDLQLEQCKIIAL